MTKRNAANVLDESKDFVVPDREPVLELEGLYVVGLGEIACGSVKCAGQTAVYTGRNRKGRPVHRITPAEAATFPADCGVLACATCGRRFTK